VEIMSQIVKELAPTGVLRAAINLGNSLLVTSRAANGDPQGVAPDMAAEVAARLGVPVRYILFERAGELADSAGSGTWGIGLIGAKPARAETIAFTPAYAEIESTYLVLDASSLKTIADVDRPGVRISSAEGSAYDLWLDRHIVNAKLVRSRGIDKSFQRFVDERLDALAGLRPRLLSDVQKLPGARILDGHFTTVQQAIGTIRANRAGADFLRAFVEAAKRSGAVARLVEKHGAQGLSVAKA
jgi:polar amino acid transport system substrate-binding protein